MKQLVYVKDEKGHVKARIINNVGLKADGSTIDIPDKILEYALKIGIFQEKAFARGYKNTYYRCNDCTLLRVDTNQVVLIDSYLASKKDDEWGFIERTNEENKVDKLDGVWLAKVFKDKSVCIKRSNGHRYSRGIPRMSLSKVTHIGYVKDEQGRNRMRNKTTPNHPVELATVIWALNEGRLSTEGWKLDIRNMELHHDGYDWDNRLCQTMYLTEQEHADYHSQIGEWSHQCYCKIETIEELVAFLEFIRCYRANR